MKKDQLEIDFKDIEKDVEVFKAKRKTTKKDIELALLKFKEILNNPPPKSFLKKNPFYGNDYLPEEVIERMLSALYTSYSFKFSFQPIVAEGNIIFFVDVILTNPVTGLIETYPGTSAVPIMPANGTLRDVHPHIPAAKTFAIMNACKHIGRLFRGENKDVTNIFSSYFTDKIKEVLSEDDKAKAHVKTRLLKMIKAKKTRESLEKISEDVMDLSDHEVNIAYANKFNSLNK